MSLREAGNHTPGDCRHERRLQQLWRMQSSVEKDGDKIKLSSNLYQLHFNVCHFWRASELVSIKNLKTEPIRLAL